MASTTPGPEIKYKWLIGPILTILVLVAGFSVGWGAVQSRISAQGVAIVELKARVTVAESRIRDVELTSVSISTQLTNLQNTMDEVRADVKDIKKGR